MPTLTAAPHRVRRLTAALYRFGSARLRRVGVGETHPDWQKRAEICEYCPMRAIRCGVSYCGKPFLQLIDRDPSIDGCGCPFHDKAKSPSEHCPIDRRGQPARHSASDCSCKWCNLRSGQF
jgi:hypothetical protein